MTHIWHIPRVKRYVVLWASLRINRSQHAYWISSKCLLIYHQLRARRALISFNYLPLKTRRGYRCNKIYGDSALLVLNGTLNTVNALLVLNGTLNTVNALLVLNGTLNTVNALLVLNGTLNTVNALLVLNGTLNTVNALLVLNGTLNTVNALLVLNGTLNTVNALLVLNGTLNTVNALLVLNGTLNTVNALLVLSRQHEVSSPVLYIQLRQLADPFCFCFFMLKSAAGMRYELVMVYKCALMSWLKCTALVQKWKWVR